MPSIHWHSSIEDVILYGVSAIIMINLIRFGAAKLAKVDGPVGTIGHAAGALVTFAGT